MLVRVTIFLLLASVSAFGQSVSSEQDFKRALDEELAKHENGAWLYSRSDVFRKNVLRHINEKLHLGTTYENKSGQMLPQSFQKFDGDVSNDIFPQNEPSVAIARGNPSRILVGSNDGPEDIRSMPAYLSNDGGITWNTSRMPSPPKPYVAFGDPFLTADQYSGFYYAFLIQNDADYLSNIMVAHSPDGVSWFYGDPVIKNKKPDASVEDKECVAVDLGHYSLTNGRVYVAWYHSEQSIEKSGLQLAWSDDFGVSWSKPVMVDSGDGFFSQIQIDDFGNIYYSYSLYPFDASISQHYLLVSHDHGATFTRRKMADFYNYPYSKFQYKPTLKGANGICAFPYITINYDVQTGTLHAVYGSYKKWNDSLSTSVLYYTFTRDEGVTWSHPYAIGFQGDSAALKTDRFMPWVAVDETTGNVHILYYSSENDSNNIKIEAYRVIFAKEVPLNYTRLSDSLFDPLHVTDYGNAPFVGDYIGCALQGTTSVYTWTENRKGLPPEQFADGEIYAYVNSVSSGVSGFHQVSANALAIFSAYPNPAAKGRITLGLAIPQSSAVSI
ncbi:MAG: sialidase family protein, partial [Candidatus Kapaibacterium sp.]